ncbi:MAG: XrtA/PEP-CTERM system histidine kinase PrsK, partial [Sphingobium sp.]
MMGFWTIFSDWGYALAAALFTVLTLITARRAQNGRADTALVIALAVTALWALHAVFSRSAGGLPGLSGGIAETVRNGAWLTVCWLLLRDTDEQAAAMPQGSRPLYYALLAALFCQLCLDMLISDAVRPSPASLPLSQAAWLLRAATALGAIFLLHGLYARLERDDGTRLGWLGCALTALWAYEFSHYLLTWATGGHLFAIGQMRGLVTSMIAPLIALGTARRDRQRIALSRRATYRAMTVAFGVTYALALFAMILLIRSADDQTTQIVQIGAVFALSVIALLMLPSAPFRTWLRVEIAKHLFTHRYDYRLEWMRFADALASGDEAGDMPYRNAARAVAHAVSAPAALLMLREEEGALLPEAHWNWPEMMMPGHGVDAERVELLHARGWIVDFLNPADPLAHALPGWMAGDARAWVLVPLTHGGRLIGAVLLARPRGRERMDWEDLDMLRVVARQLAVTLSEQRQQRALVEAQRFDEFNRRFAFILHDIKNMVSQMSLLAANAERHADNPEFRTDMVLTLKETAGRMTDLIARLARADPQRSGETTQCDLMAVAADVAAQGRARGRVILSGEKALPVRGDAGRLAQAIGHLVHNALDATVEDGPPVRLSLSRDDGMARLDIADQGCGMSPAFLRDGLFRPFTSTKANGFGLGAHEARMLVNAMGGRLTVASREGEGSQFTISLPLINDNAVAHPAIAMPPLFDRKTG